MTDNKEKGFEASVPLCSMYRCFSFSIGRNYLITQSFLPILIYLKYFFTFLLTYHVLSVILSTTNKELTVLTKLKKERYSPPET